MVQKRVFGLISAVARAGEAALVSVLALLAGAGCVEPNPQPPYGGAGGPDICAQKFAGNCYEQGGGGHGSSDAGQGGSSGSDAGTGGDGGSDPAGAGGSPAGSGGAGGSGDCVDGHGSTGPDGKECPNHAGSGGTGSSGAGAGGASGDGGKAGGASGAGQGGSSGTGGAGAGGASGSGGSSGAGQAGSGGQVALKPWGCKDFVVDTGFEDQQPTDDFSRWYQSMHVVGPYVLGGNSWGVDVLTKKNGAWTKIHVPESGSGVVWAAGPDKGGDYWFAAMGTTGNPGLFKGQGQNWSLVADAPPAYGYSRMVFAPDGTLYALASDGQGRLWKRTPSGQWKDLIGNHPMKDMGVEGLAYVGGVIYASAYEIDQSGTQYLAAHIYGYEGGKWVEIPGIASKAVILSGLEPSGEYGLAASGAKSDGTSTALFVELPSKTVTVAPEKAGFGYGVLYSPRFGSYLSATQLVKGEADGVAVLYDSLGGLTTFKPFTDTNNSLSFFFSSPSGPAVFYQPVRTTGKARFATATCGEL